jgi:hypothetical protein
MKTSTLRILCTLAGVAAATAAQAGKPHHHHTAAPPRNTAPVVQLPPDAQAAAIPTPLAGPTVSLPAPRDDFYAAQARARPAAPSVTTQARTDTPAAPPAAYRGGEHGPMVDLPQQ